MNKSLIKSLFSIMLMSLLISTSIISAQHTSNSKIKLINTAEEDSSEGSYLPLPLVYNFNTLEIETVELSGQIFSKVILEEHSNFHETGKPVLPVASAKVLIPYGEKFEDIEISSVDTISISVDDPVEPGQQFYPFSYEGDIEYIPPDSEIYESDSLFPDKKYEIVSVQKFRGFNVLILRLYPVQYNPKNGQLLFTPTLKIENIETTPIDPDQYHQNYRGLQKDIDAVSSFVDNPETIESYPGSFPSEVYQYVIITSEELKNYNGDFNFQALRDEHISGGLNAKIVTIEEIENGYTGIDTQQKIRNFIRYAYNNWQTEYVLLGGDDPIVPARILHAFIPFYGYLPIPADLYYSCLDGPYNYNGDELWGDCNDGENGGDVDLLADVYIGRACVDNTQDVSNFVSKTIAYINSEGDPYLKKALQVGELLWDGPEGKTWGADYMDELIDGCFNHGYSTTGIPSSEYTISKLYDKTWSGNDWPRSAIINRINNNYHFINHVGHSTVDKIMKMNPDDVLALSNLKFNFIYSQGCFAGSFVNADCMAEYFTVKTDNGAVAAIMNAHLGIGQYLGTDGPSQRYHREFWDAVFGDMTNTFGKAIQGCREDNLYRINENFMRFCFYEINLFGDPAAELIHGPHPQLACYPKSYTTKYNRSDPVSFSFEIWNAGEETLYYSLFVDCGDDNDDCKWVTINPTQGGSTGEHDTIQVDIDTSGIVNIHETYIIWIYSNGGKEAFTINLDRKSRSLNRNIWGNEFPLLDLLNNFLNRMPSLQYLLQRLIE